MQPGQEKQPEPHLLLRRGGSAIIRSCFHSCMLTALPCFVLLLWLVAPPLTAKPVAKPLSNQQKAKHLEKQATELIHRGNFGAAKVLLLRAIELDPNAAEIWWDLGRSYYNNMDKLDNGLVEAERCFRKSIQLSHDNASVYGSLADVLIIQNRNAEAIKVCDEGMKAKWASNVCLGHKAIALSNLNRGQEALVLMDRYIATAEDESDRIYGMETKAGMLLNLHKYKDALAVYRQVYAKKQSDAYLLRQFECLEKLGQTDDALHVLGILLAKNPKDEDALVRRARLHGRKGDLKKAEADYTRALGEMKTSTFLRERAEIYKRMGRQDLYMADLKAADEL